jgi:hypothetical protein
MTISNLQLCATGTYPEVITSVHVFITISLRFVLILSYHLCLGLPSILFPPEVITQIQSSNTHMKHACIGLTDASQATIPRREGALRGLRGLSLTPASTV